MYSKNGECNMIEASIFKYVYIKQIQLYWLVENNEAHNGSSALPNGNFSFYYRWRNRRDFLEIGS